MPCILHWNLNHFVVLKRVTRKHVVIANPATGEQRLTWAEVSQHFTGVALELTPTAKFKAEDQRRRIHIPDMIGSVRGVKRTLVQVFLLALALEVFALASPLFNQFVIDDVLVTADRELLSTLLVGFALLLVTQVAIGLLRSWVIVRVSMEVRFQWVSNLFSHLIRLPVAFFEKRHLGDIVSRFGSITTIQNTLTTAVVTAILDGIMATLGLVMMLIYSIQLSMIVVLAVALYSLLRWIFYRPFREASSERLILSAKEQSHFLETLRAITPIKLAGQELERRAYWQNLLTDVFNRDIKTQKLGIIFTSANSAISSTATLLVFYIGAHQVISGILSIGMLMTFSSYQQTFSSRIASLIGYLVDLKMLSLHAERLADIAYETPEEQPQFDVDLSDLEPRLEIRNLSFRYADGEPWVLKNVNLLIEPGESIAITGPSGCGKTTLMKIMLGLLNPTAGDIFLDGHTIQSIGLTPYRRYFGAVLQDDSLLAGSLSDNISFFAARPDNACILESAQIASIHDEIMAMSMNYNTLVGDMGTVLSGGQKQRVLLARAFYKRPRILCLDEATSHLDTQRERQVNGAIGSLAVTRIIIAHRPETIASADRVIVMSQGRIVQDPNQLLPNVTSLVETAM
jgi:ATP-binding cassette subfamily B protein RaxB